MINEDIRHIVEAELREGETLLWADRPIAPPSKNKGLLYLCIVIFIAFSLLFISLSNIEFGNALFESYWRFLIWITIPIFLVGSAKEFLRYNHYRQNIFYALTSKRLLIIAKNSATQVHEYTKENLYWLKPKMKKRDGFLVSDFGDIEIIPKDELRWGQAKLFEDLLLQNKKIQNIHNVYRVMEMIFQNILLKESPYEQAH